MKEVEFGWVGGGGGVQIHNHVKPNSVEVFLRLRWGCDNISLTLASGRRRRWTLCR